MQFCGLEEQEVLQAATAKFVDKAISVSSCDLFLRDIEQGEIRLSGIEHPLYVSTHYVYEDHIVNGNPTRYKVPLTTILVKEDMEQIIYDSTEVYYVAYKEQEIHFIRYDAFHDFIKEYIEVVENA